MNIRIVKYKRTKTHIYYNLTSYLLCFLSFMYATPLSAYGYKQYESWYQEVWCDSNRGETEVRLNDGTRVDCLTKDYAIEVEFAKKWTQAIGQALHYSLKTNKKPGIVIILTKHSDEHYWLSINKLIEHHNLPIRTWKLGP